MRTAVMVVAMALAAPATAEDDRWAWRRSDTVLQLTYTALHLADWSQTLDIARRAPTERLWVEGNGLLGPTPSRGEVHAYMIGTLLLQWGVAYALPRPYRTAWQCLTIGVETSAVGTNLSAGVRFSL